MWNRDESPAVRKAKGMIALIWTGAIVGVVVLTLFSDSLSPIPGVLVFLPSLLALSYACYHLDYLWLQRLWVAQGKLDKDEVVPPHVLLLSPIGKFRRK